MEHEGGQAVDRPHPRLLRLLARSVNRPVGAHAVDRAHVAVAKAAHVQAVDRLEGRGNVVGGDDGRQARGVGVPLARELVGHDAVGVGAAAGVVEVVAAVPQLRLEGLLARRQPGGVARRGLGVADELAHLDGCFQRAQPQPARVGTDAVHRPGVVGLVRQALVVGQAVAVAVEGVQVVQRLDHVTPGVAHQRLVLGEDVVAPDLEHELAVQVLPNVDVLEVVGVGLEEGVFARHAQVVGQRASRLARRLLLAPLHGPEGWVALGHRGGEVADDALLQFGPQQRQRIRGVEVHVEGVVERVVEALQKREVAHLAGHAACRRSRAAVHAAGLPHRPAVHQVVEFVEQRRLVPVGPRRVLEDGPLPGVNLGLPLGAVGQGVGGDGPGVAPRHAVELGVPLVPLRPRAELGDGKVPGQGEGNRPRLAGRQVHLDRQRPHQHLPARRWRRVVHVAQPTRCREVNPHAARIGEREARLVGDGDAGLVGREQGKLAVPLVLDAVALARHDQARQPIALERLVEVAALEVAPPLAAHHVLPGQHHADGQRLVGRVLEGPFEQADRVAALAVVAGDDGRELALGQLDRHPVPVVDVPRRGEQAVVRPRADRPVPVPVLEAVGAQRREDMRLLLVALLDKQRELVGGQRLERVLPQVQTPAGEVAARRAANRPRAQPP